MRTRLSPSAKIVTCVTIERTLKIKCFKLFFNHALNNTIRGFLYTIFSMENTSLKRKPYHVRMCASLSNISFFIHCVLGLLFVSSNGKTVEEVGFLSCHVTELLLIIRLYFVKTAIFCYLIKIPNNADIKSYQQTKKREKMFTLHQKAARGMTVRWNIIT